MRPALLLVLASCVNVPPFAGGDGGTGDGAQSHDGSIDSPTDRITVRVSDRVVGAPLADATVYVNGAQMATTNAQGVAEVYVNGAADVLVVIDTAEVYEAVTFSGVSNGAELLVGEPDTRSTAVMPIAITFATLESGAYYQAFSPCASNGAGSPSLQLPRTARCNGPFNPIQLVQRQDDAIGRVIAFKNIFVTQDQATYVDTAQNYIPRLERGMLFPPLSGAQQGTGEIRTLEGGEILTNTMLPAGMGTSGLYADVAAGNDGELEYVLSVSDVGTVQRFMRRAPATATDIPITDVSAPPRPLALMFSATNDTVNGITWTPSGGGDPAMLAVVSASEMRSNRKHHWRWIAAAPTTAQILFPLPPPGIALPSKMGSYELQLVKLTGAQLAHALAIADRATLHATRYFALPGITHVTMAIGARATL